MRKLREHALSICIGNIIVNTCLFRTQIEHFLHNINRIKMTRHRNSPSHQHVVSAAKRARQMLKSIVSMECLQNIIEMDDLDETASNNHLLSYIEKSKVSAARKDSAKKRRFRQRKSWTAFADKVPNMIPQHSKTALCTRLY